METCRLIGNGMNGWHRDVMGDMQLLFEFRTTHFRAFLLLCCNFDAFARFLCCTFTLPYFYGVGCSLFFDVNSIHSKNVLYKLTNLHMVSILLIAHQKPIRLNVSEIWAARCSDLLIVSFLLLKILKNWHSKVNCARYVNIFVGGF